ncbi:hypothetical protein [Stakelama saccharophila]|uniref:TonB C-terminal domain-containing protein n=1 Tax=Stakelama saccharophila TaxID=3075605 RepID=A0ABZ0BB29_9SPHN|nr:hypothetical protein [Stakelama sp. W311]WNO54483.1 hypothetical protein RPR59_04305 [Stakelama sp. W311]
MIAFAISIPVAQAMPPETSPAAPQEIVVTAKAGRVALVFDKGEDGRLHNCRVLISSGVDRIDDRACDDLPDCVEDQTGHRFCGDALWRPAAKNENSPDEAGVAIKLPKLVQPDADPAPVPEIGPVGAGGRDEEADRQLVDLPPPPEPVSEPTIRITGGAPAERE